MTHNLWNRLIAILALISGLLMDAPPAAADTWTEVGDAGQLPGTAQITVGVGALDAIQGTLPTDGINPPDIDVFRIVITDPDAFSATTVNPETEFIETELYLFRADGTGVIANGDTDTLESRSTIPAGSLSAATTPPGEYLLAMALFESRPVNSSGQFLFPDLFLNTAVEQPLLPNDPLADWNTQPILEPFLNYQINLTGSTFAAQPSPPPTTPIPEPTSLITWLAASTALLLFARHRTMKFATGAEQQSALREQMRTRARR